MSFFPIINISRKYMLTNIPPSAIRPKQSRGPDKSLFTIHKSNNTVYASKPKNELLMISVVSFTNREHALMIASMLEEYKSRTSEWPLLFPEEEIFLPTSQGNNELMELTIQRWAKDDLTVYCVEHMMDLITIQNIQHTKGTLNITGDTYKFDAPIDFYQQLFDTILALPSH